MINGPVEKFKVVTILDSPFLDAVEYFHDGKKKFVLEMLFPVSIKQTICAAMDTLLTC